MGMVRKRDTLGTRQRRAPPLRFWGLAGSGAGQVGCIPPFDRHVWRVVSHTLTW